MNGLKDLQSLNFGQVFRIPDYQRSYSWDESQWQDLLDDLDVLREGRDHFTGTIVLQSVPTEAPIKDQGGRQHSVVDVVDGQQRITTLQLLLDAIRRAMSDLGLDALSQGIGGDYLWILNKDGVKLPRLQLTDGSQTFFEAEILRATAGPTRPATPAEDRLLRASRHFRRYLEEQQALLGDDFRDWLDALQTKITNRLRFTTYEASPDDDVGMIFEVLNDRGRGLTEMDKVKNYVLYLAGQMGIGDDSREMLRNQVKDAWSKVFGALMRADLGTAERENQLLRNHWLMAHESASRGRPWRGSRAIKDTFNLKSYTTRDEELLAGITEYVSLLGRTSGPYCDVLRPTRPGAFDRFPDRSAAERAGDCLVRCGAPAPFLPLLMAQRLTAPEDSGAYATLAWACERYAFRVYRIGLRRSGIGTTRLQRLGFDLFHGHLTAAEAAQRVLTISLDYLTEKDFQDAFAPDEESPDQDANDWYHWDGLRYLLYEYERHLWGKADPEVAWDELSRVGERSIEHILPQQPRAGEWMEFSEEDRSRLTHDFGNLCLTLDNSRYSNKSYKSKRGYQGASFACYAEGKLAMERRLAGEYPEWTPDSLRSRRAQIAEWVSHRWAIDPGELGGTQNGWSDEPEILAEAPDEEEDLG